MSYDIAFRVKAEGADRWLEVGDCDANITWNVREIITRSTGLAWRNEENNGLCSEVIPRIEAGLRELERFPERYRPYEAENGWGTVEGTRHFFRRILSAWEKLKRDDPELAGLAAFWVE